MDYDERDQGGAEPPPFNLEPGERAEEAFSRHAVADYADPIDLVIGGNSPELQAAVDAFHADYSKAVSELSTSDLVEALYHDRPETRHQAVCAFRSEGRELDLAALPHLTHMLYEESEDSLGLVDSIIEAVAAYGAAADDAVPALLAKLPSNDHELPEGAHSYGVVTALGAIGTAQARQALEELADRAPTANFRVLVEGQLHTIEWRRLEQEHGGVVPPLHRLADAASRGEELASTADHTVIPVQEDTPLWRDALDFLRAWYDHVRRKGAKEGLDLD